MACGLATTPDVEVIAPTTWTAWQSAADGLFPKGVRAYWKNTSFDRLDDATIEVIVRRGREQTWHGTGFDIHLMDGRVRTRRRGRDAVPGPVGALLAEHLRLLARRRRRRRPDRVRARASRRTWRRMRRVRSTSTSSARKGSADGGPSERAGRLRTEQARSADGTQAPLRSGQRLPAQPQHPAGLIPQRRISTTSPSTTSWSRPTRWPSNRADGPHTRAPLKLAPRS